MYKQLAVVQKLPMFAFRTHTTTLSPVEQSSMLSAKFEARQNCSLFATAHDCETGLHKYVMTVFHLTSSIYAGGPEKSMPCCCNCDRSKLFSCLKSSFCCRKMSLSMLSCSLSLISCAILALCVRNSFI